MQIPNFDRIENSKEKEKKRCFFQDHIDIIWCPFTFIIQNLPSCPLPLPPLPLCHPTLIQTSNISKFKSLKYHSLR